ncbi:transglutaminase domain-containing protein [Chryseobacterium pennipullorum]|uniref:transglutaminase domain-containing protein n=1 Tax=Chryseobacterium pennipullorum TaxID=2258963 RepID=UPI000F4FA25A|nr:transglutaminase domain-containing protein [Chryseobacterium pennipullorum]
MIEYKYKIESAQIFTINQVMEYDIPVVYEEFNLEHPQSLAYNFNNPGNLLIPKYNVSITENRSNLLYHIFRYGYENVKPVKNELFVKDPSRYRTKLKAQLAYLSMRYRSGEFTYDKSTDWNKVAELLSEDEKFGGFLKGDVSGIVPDEIKNYYEINERANRIFNFVKTNYKWNRQSCIIPSQNLRQLLKSKAGNSADINLLLVLLLRNAGIEANPLLISTVDNGILNITSMDVDGMNFALAATKINGTFNLYDATSYNAKANLMRQRNWNEFGILFQKNKGTEIAFTNNNISEKKSLIHATVNTEDLEIKGDYTQEVSGLYALEEYEDFDLNKDKYNQSFKTKLEVNTTEVDSRLLDNSNFETKLKFSGSNLVDKVGEKLIINSSLFLKSDIETFDQADARKYPIDFISGFVKEKKVELTIPENYRVGDLPKNKKIKTDDQEISYSYLIENKGEKLILTSRVEVKHSTYPKEFYPAFKQIWKSISDCENQVISLVKK